MVIQTILYPKDGKVENQTIIDEYIDQTTINGWSDHRLSRTASGGIQIKFINYDEIDNKSVTVITIEGPELEVLKEAILKGLI
jgi:hypothetical protein